ncbi:hypothetical protein BDW74DRAFT_179144 [Aspergillus multicolor]|uniref:uncharacterized protein n=1 Tax=Aspergillus multicolor TaxID=41759 RepID=UPI003CCDE3F3
MLATTPTSTSIPSRAPETLQLVLEYGHSHPHIREDIAGIEEAALIPHPGHLMLTLVPADNTRCTWIHVGNGPFRYEVRIENNKNVMDTRAELDVPIGNISSTQVPALRQLARSIIPQRCRLYIASLLEAMVEHEIGNLDSMLVEHFRSTIPRSVGQTMEDSGKNEFVRRLYAFLSSRRYRFFGEADMVRCTCFFDESQRAPTEFVLSSEGLHEGQYALRLTSFRGNRQDWSSLESLGISRRAASRSMMTAQAGVAGGNAVAGSSTRVTNPDLRYRRANAETAEQRDVTLYVLDR